MVGRIKIYTSVLETHFIENQAFLPATAKCNSQFINLQIQRATWREVNVLKLKWNDAQ